MKNPQDLLQELRTKLNREILQIERRDDLTEDQKVRRILHSGCALCAGIATQPLPFADIVILTPIQAVMAWKFAQIRGVHISESDAKQIVGELLGILGLGLGAQHLALSLYKLGLPFLGGMMTIPLVYALTYSIGTVADAYFSARAEGREMAPEEIRSRWKEARAEGRKRGSAYHKTTSDGDRAPADQSR